MRKYWRMKCISITPKIGGISYYILFEIETIENRTIYTIADDPQSRGLKLPINTTITRITYIDKTFAVTSQEVIVDPRVNKVGQIDLCLFLYYFVVQEEKSRPAERKLRPWWYSENK